jgi:hypothetical protein
MNCFALLLLLAAAPTSLRRVVTDEVYTIPPSDWRYVSLAKEDPPLAIECEFHVVSGRSEVRIAVVDEAGLAALRQGRPLNAIAVTPYSRDGRLLHHIRDSGQYSVIVENGQGQQESAKVQLRLAMDFSARVQPQPGQLSPARRMAVIAISLVVFFAIALYSGKKLLPAFR